MSQQKKKSTQQQQQQQSAVVSGGGGANTLPVKDDRKQLVSSRTSPLIRVRFRNPIRSSVCGGNSDAAAASSDGPKGSSGKSAGRESSGAAERRRLSLDGMSAESKSGGSGGGKASSEETTVTTTSKDDLGLEPRTCQYEKHELLQQRSPESGLTEVEAFLLEKQRLMELGQLPTSAADSPSDGADSDGDEADDDKLVPRAPLYEPHPILQVKTDSGLTELELYFMQKEAQQQVEETAKSNAAVGCAGETAPSSS